MEANGKRNSEVIYDYEIVIPRELISRFRELLRAGIDGVASDETDLIELAEDLLRQLS
jgi:hypothetical protein